MAIPQKAPPPVLPSYRDYEEDLVAWALDNAALLRAGRLSEIDALSLAEELEDLGKSERRALGSHLRTLVTHLLEWQCQPERRGTSWRLSIRNARAEIRTILADSPSLVREVEPLLAGTYELARDNASGETGLPEAAFPQGCPYAAEQCLSDDFWPG
jgi:hypothetical protein